MDTISTENSQANHPQPDELEWRQAVADYQSSSLHQSVWQILNTLIPYFTLWFLAYRSLEVSFWLTMTFTFAAALFGLRVFIIFHDCGHGSFFKSRKANDFLGVFLGVLVFTPYYAWRHSHAIHHATSGDLDRRGIGDVWTLTYKEYQLLPRKKQLLYRAYRNPIVIFIIAPVFQFVVMHRFSFTNSSTKRREKNSVLWTNLILLGIFIAMSLTIGVKAYILVQLPITAIAASIGVWLFYVQHQYENTYWEWHEEWDYAAAALYGSSFYKLPKVLQWLTGNIGFHHIHHLSPRIPNYKLETCHYENPVFSAIPPLTLRTSLKSLYIRLWDEDRHKMIGSYKLETDLKSESIAS